MWFDALREFYATFSRIFESLQKFTKKHVEQTAITVPDNATHNTIQVIIITNVYKNVVPLYRLKWPKQPVFRTCMYTLTPHEQCQSSSALAHIIIAQTCKFGAVEFIEVINCEQLHVQCRVTYCDETGAHAMMCSQNHQDIILTHSQSLCIACASVVFFDCRLQTYNSFCYTDKLVWTRNNRIHVDSRYCTKIETLYDYTIYHFKTSQLAEYFMKKLYIANVPCGWVGNYMLTEQ